MVVQLIKKNGDRAKKLLLTVVPMIAAEDWSKTIQAHKELVQTSVMLPWELSQVKRDKVNLITIDLLYWTVQYCIYIIIL